MSKVSVFKFNIKECNNSNINSIIKFYLQK